MGSNLLKIVKYIGIAIQSHPDRQRWYFMGFFCICEEKFYKLFKGAILFQH